ncbi:LPS export ABC transporter permease LptF [Motiliproteus sediminis]|uniref:LPS export ABC transporter permease LptF n=1 Tax=Motiliproteus sediminis TaxID=1468178 RepID=UPI001AEFB052|nr:LPS export ABC transporter permease LptF [Motiliproteus sediminis]
MIIFRYLAREVLTTMVAVTGVLLLIIMSGRFIKYLADAASGELAAGVLFQLIGLRIPGFLELILPLGLFLGILLSYGRLYLENEIAVLNACGISPARLQWLTLGPALLVALLVGALSLWVTPLGAAKVERILKEQESATDFDALTTGQFQIQGRNRATYVERMEQERQVARNVFMADRSRHEGEPRQGVVAADRALQFIDPDSGSRFLILYDGVRYEGVPGRADYREIRFKEYGVKMRESRVRDEVAQAEALPTVTLLQGGRDDYRAQLHWRLSLPVLCIVVTLLAVPLSRVNPRQGRYARMLPSILIYLMYLAALTSVRSKIEKQGLSPAALWAVHGLVLALAANLHLFGGAWQRLFDAIGSVLGGLVWRRGGKA